MWPSTTPLRPCEVEAQLQEHAHDCSYAIHKWLAVVRYRAVRPMMSMKAGGTLRVVSIHKLTAWPEPRSHSLHIMG